jgi:hypothetical protein
VRLDLRAILYEKDEAIAIGHIAQFRVKWKAQRMLMKYLNKNYFGGDPLFDEEDGNTLSGDDAFDNRDSGDEEPFVEDPVVTAAVEVPVVAAVESIQLTTQEVAEQDRQIDIARKQRCWMFCYRQDLSYASIDTNNYIESWHNTLKQHFFRDKQQRRVDTVIYVLNVMAVPHYQRKCMRSLVNVGNPAQRAEAKHLKKIKDFLATKGEMGVVMYQLKSDVVAVGSFTTPGAFYELKIDFTRISTGHIVSCICLAFAQEEACMQAHIFIAVGGPPFDISQGRPRRHPSRFGSVGVGSSSRAWAMGPAAAGASPRARPILLSRSHQQPGGSSRQE